MSGVEEAVVPVLRKQPTLKKSQLDDAERKVKAAVYAAFLNPVLRPFGTACTGFGLRCDVQFPGMACVYHDGRSGRSVIFFDPLTASETTSAGVITIMVHEMSHVVLMHTERLLNVSKEDEGLARMAKEFECNCILDEIAHIPVSPKFLMVLPMDKAPPGALYDPQFSGKSAETIFQELKLAKARATPKKFDISIPGMGTFRTTETTLEIGDKEYVDHSVEFIPDPDFKLGDGKDNDPLNRSNEKSVDRSVALARAMASTTPGLMSTSLGAILGVVKTRVDWQTITTGLLRNALSRDTDTSWSKPNMKTSFMGGDWPFPGEIPEFRAKALFYSMDQSGSIDEVAAGKMLDIAFQSASYFEKLIVVWHDHSAVDGDGMEIAEFDTPFAEDAKEQIMTRKFFGGTSHAGVVKELKDQMARGVEISLAMFLTDLHSDLQNLELPTEVPMVWVVPLAHNASITLPGRKVIME